MRKATSFTISSDILNEIAKSKGSNSTSERVNTLLRKALELERRERFEEEAAEFFKNTSDHVDSERTAFLKASKKTLSRD